MNRFEHQAHLGHMLAFDYTFPAKPVKLLTKEKRSDRSRVALRTCRMSCLDAIGVEHTVEVTACSLYEAVARGLHILRQNDWVDGIRQNSTITIAVKEPEVEHRVRIKDFENWLASNGKSPAEQALKTDLRALFNRIETKRERRGRELTWWSVIRSSSHAHPRGHESRRTSSCRSWLETTSAMSLSTANGPEPPRTRVARQAIYRRLIS
jgi:hypothetical protein